MHNYFWSYVLGAIGLVLLMWMIPKYRQQLAKDNLPLEQRYAKEIASGEAVITPKDPAALKKFVFLIICGGVFILLFQRFKDYTSSLKQTCTTIGGWNGLFIFLGGVFIVGGILCLITILSTYKDYKEIIEDGYAPSRKNKLSQDRISFKLTKWLKLKEQLRLIILTACSILFISSPIILLQILMNTPTHKATSIYALNEHLQKVCLDDLKKKDSFK